MQQLTLDEIPELLARLVDKSLVQVDANGRFDLLQLVRQFCQEEIARTQDAAHIRTKHLEYYSEFCKEQAPKMVGPNLLQTTELFSIESENVRQAVEWAISNEQTWPLAAQIVDDTFWAQFIHGKMTEGITLTSLVIASAAKECDAETLAGMYAILASYQQLNDHPDAMATCDKAIELSERAQSSRTLSRALFQKAYMALRDGQWEEGQPLLLRAMELVRPLRRADDRQLAFAILSILANSAVMTERFEEAKRYYEECLAICDELQYARGYAVLYGNLSQLSERLGNYKEAHEYATKPLRTFLDLNDMRNLAGTIANSASGFWLAGDYETAARAVGCAFGIWAKSESVPDTIDHVGAERWRARLSQKMGDDAFTFWFEKGKATSAKDMVEQILANPQPWH